MNAKRNTGCQISVDFLQCFAGGIDALKNGVPNYTQDRHFESFHLCGNMPLLRFIPAMLSLWAKIHHNFYGRLM